MILISLPKIYNNPTKMKASAISAVELSVARSRISAKGKKMTSCMRIKYGTGMSLRQLVTPRTND